MKRKVSFYCEGCKQPISGTEYLDSGLCGPCYIAAASSSDEYVGVFNQKQTYNEESQEEKLREQFFLAHPKNGY
jgi:hypothetical protein